MSRTVRLLVLLLVATCSLGSRRRGVWNGFRCSSGGVRNRFACAPRTALPRCLTYAWALLCLFCLISYVKSYDQILQTQPNFTISTKQLWWSFRSINCPHYEDRLTQQQLCALPHSLTLVSNGWMLTLLWVTARRLISNDAGSSDRSCTSKDHGRIDLFNIYSNHQHKRKSINANPENPSIEALCAEWE